MTFDEQVAALRGAAGARCCNKRKKDATPAEWAAHLDYCLPRSRKYIARERDAANARARLRRAAKLESKPEEVRSAERERTKRWRLRNTGYWRPASVQSRIAKSLRTRTFMAVRSGAKAGSAVSDLGCSIADFQTHIESLLPSGESWLTWGELWSLDHIYPLSQANLTDRAQFLAVANWRNYQPLPVGENSSKKDAVSDAARERFEVLANFAEVLHG